MERSLGRAPYRIVVASASSSAKRARNRASTSAGPHRLEVAGEIMDRQVGLAEQLARLRNREAGKRGRLEIGRGAVGDLDAALEIIRQFGRQAEADKDRPLEARLDPLVIAADRRLERRDHVADHIFGRVMQQRRQPRLARRGRIPGREQSLHQQRMLRDGEDLGPLRLAVPARHARQPMGDVADLDVERRRIDEIEPPSRQHPLPGAARRRSLMGGVRAPAPGRPRDGSNRRDDR